MKNAINLKSYHLKIFFLCIREKNHLLISVTFSLIYSSKTQKFLLTEIWQTVFQLKKENKVPTKTHYKACYKPNLVQKTSIFSLIQNNFKYSFSHIYNTKNCFCFNPICGFEFFFFLMVHFIFFCDANNQKLPLNYVPTGKANLVIINIGPTT